MHTALVSKKKGVTIFITRHRNDSCYWSWMQINPTLNEKHRASRQSGAAAKSQLLLLLLVYYHFFHFILFY